MDGIQRVLTVLRKSLVTGPALPSEGTFQKPAEPSLPCSNQTGDRTWLSPTCFFGLILYHTPFLVCAAEYRLSFSFLKEPGSFLPQHSSVFLPLTWVSTSVPLTPYSPFRA